LHQIITNSRKEQNLPKTEKHNREKFCTVIHKNSLNNEKTDDLVAKLKWTTADRLAPSKRAAAVFLKSIIAINITKVSKVPV